MPWTDFLNFVPVVGQFKAAGEAISRAPDRRELQQQSQNLQNQLMELQNKEIKRQMDLKAVEVDRANKAFDQTNALGNVLLDMQSGRPLDPNKMRQAQIPFSLVNPEVDQFGVMTTRQPVRMQRVDDRLGPAIDKLPSYLRDQFTDLRKQPAAPQFMNQAQELLNKAAVQQAMSDRVIQPNERETPDKKLDRLIRVIGQANNARKAGLQYAWNTPQRNEAIEEANRNLFAARQIATDLSWDRDRISQWLRPIDPAEDAQPEEADAWYNGVFNFLGRTAKPSPAGSPPNPAAPGNVKKTVVPPPVSSTPRGNATPSEKKVMVEKAGKRYLLPAKQLEQARSQGYREVP